MGSEVGGVGGGGGGDSGQLYTLCSFTAKLLYLVLYMFFIRSSHHLNRHIHVVHLFGKDGDMFVCLFCGE